MGLPFCDISKTALLERTCGAQYLFVMLVYRPLTDFTGISAELKRISLLGGLTEDQLNKLYPRLETGVVPPGETIAHEGETPTHIHIILRGCVNLLLTQNGETVAKRQFTVGDSFGEAALLSLINNTASFVAAKETELIVLSRRTLYKLHREEIELFSQLILNTARDLARKLQYTDIMLMSNTKQR